jgi:transposase
LLSGWRRAGVVAPWAFPGATDTPALERSVAPAWAPQLRAGEVVIGDNLKPHHAAGARRAVAGAGALLMPLPPSSPDPTPIAERFSKVKGGPRSAATRTTEAVYDAMGAALRAACPEDILGWFKSRGLYATQG